MTSLLHAARSSRRSFGLAVGAATLCLFAPRAARSLEESRAALAPGSAARPVLVCLFLRGAADGLSLVVPHGEGEYYKARPRIAIARPGQTDGAVALDERFGLHPRLGPLAAAYRGGELAIVHAVGSPHATRSHFEAQDYMETGMPGQVISEGWLGRYLQAQRPLAEPSSDELRAVALGHGTPLALRGYPGVVSAPRLRAFALRAPRGLRRPLERAFLRMYDEDRGNAAPEREPLRDGDQLLRTGHDALTAARRLRKLGLAQYQPEHGATYSKENEALRDVAAVIKADVGLEVAWLDIGGWDTHQNQGNGDTGRLARSLAPWGAGLAAFRADLGARFEHVLVLVLTEFGRTLRENGSGGTDHGHGSAMLLLGGRVQGGKVYGRWPGLEPAALWEGRDLAVTTDYRDVYSEVATGFLGQGDVSRILPGHPAGPALGLFRS